MDDTFVKHPNSLMTESAYPITTTVQHSNLGQSKCGDYVGGKRRGVDEVIFMTRKFYRATKAGTIKPNFLHEEIVRYLQLYRLAGKPSIKLLNVPPQPPIQQADLGKCLGPNGQGNCEGTQAIPGMGIKHRNLRLGRRYGTVVCIHLFQSLIDFLHIDCKMQKCRLY